MDIHPGKVYSFYSIYLTNWEKLPIFGHFYPGRVFYFSVKYSPLGDLLMYTNNFPLDIIDVEVQN